MITINNANDSRRLSARWLSSNASRLKPQSFPPQPFCSHSKPERPPEGDRHRKWWWCSINDNEIIITFISRLIFIWPQQLGNATTRWFNCVTKIFRLALRHWSWIQSLALLVLQTTPRRVVWILYEYILFTKSVYKITFPAATINCI